MNNNEYILNQEIKNRRILLKMYLKQEKKIKEQLYNAYLEKRSTRYLENLNADIQKEISALNAFFQEYAKGQTKESYLNGVKQADNQFNKLSAGAMTAGFNFGNVNREAVKVLARETFAPLDKVTKTLSRNCQNYLNRENFESTEKALKALGGIVDSKTLRKMGVEGVSGVVFGNKTWQEAMRSIRDDIISKGALKVPYFKKNGDLARLVSVQDYCKMVARTTTAHIMREGTKDRIMEVYGDDGDLVEIIGISVYPNSPCIPYQGKILSISGNTDEEITNKLGSDYAGLLDDAEANGLFHPNCIHTMGVTDKITAVYGYDPQNEDNKPNNENTNEEPTEQLENKQEFKPAQNIKEAEDFAENNLEITKAEYKGLDLEVVNRMNKTFYEYKQSYPEIFENFNYTGNSKNLYSFVKTNIYHDEFCLDAFKKLNPNINITNIKSNDLSKYIEAIRRQYLKPFTVGSKTIATSWRGNNIYSGIVYNPVKSYKEEIKKYAIDVKNEFHPRGTASVEGIMHHELGHRMDYLLNLRNNKEIQALFDEEMANNTITKNLSRYSWDNSNKNRYAEFIAEAWGEYKTAKQPRELAKKVGKIIEKEYKLFKHHQV